jgi:Glycosyltransferase family 87
MSVGAQDAIDAPRRTPGMSTPAKLGVGAVVILLWGLLFDQLARVSGWILDTYSAVVLPPLLDLHSRYRDASIAVHKGVLYGFRHGAFTYPPITAYLFAPFHAIGWKATAILWTVANVVVLALLFTITLWRFFAVPGPTAWLVSATGLAPAAIFLLYPFRSLLYWGQLALFLLFVVFVDLFVVPPRFRGVLIGIAAAVKLLPALFIVWLLARREYPAALRVIGSFAVLTLVAVALWPHASAQYWFHILPSGQDVAMVANPTNVATSHGRWYFGVGKVVNQSLRGLLARPPFLLPGTMPWLLLAVAVLALGVVVTIRLLGQRRDLLAFVVLSLTTVLVSPVSWVHYWVFVALAPFAAVLEWRRDRVLSVASMILTVSVCANLEDTRLDGLFALGRQFSSAAPIVVFAVRNLYVLGGLVFLAIVAWRTLVPSAASADELRSDVGLTAATP